MQKMRCNTEIWIREHTLSSGEGLNRRILIAATKCLDKAIISFEKAKGAICAGNKQEKNSLEEVASVYTDLSYFLSGITHGGTDTTALAGQKIRELETELTMSHGKDTELIKRQLDELYAIFNLYDYDDEWNRGETDEED